MKYDKEYLDEVSKWKLLKTLNESKNRIGELQRMITNKDGGAVELNDNDTKKSILELCDTINEVYDREMSRELDNQKSSGKEFVSDDDIDRIINEAKNEL